jgi:pimeloyl-ACP methyl ester carboxylesterase
VAYSSAGIDADTAPADGTAAADPGMSDAVYYAVTCNDYGLDASKEADRLSAYLAAGRAFWPDGRVVSPYYGDLPCVFWPVKKQGADVAPFTAKGVPVLVVNATGDGATPMPMGESVFAYLADGYEVTRDGGSHVSWGDGDQCLDSVVTAFVLDGTRPTTRSTRCADTFVSAPKK